MTQAITLAVLAGGKSSRMGVNKALQTIGDQALIEHVLAIHNHILFQDIMIMTNSPNMYKHLNYQTVADTHIGQGAVCGIHSALQHSTTEYVLILACDMPFIQTSLINLLIEHTQSSAYKAIIPTVKRYPQGVIALYHRDCLAHLESAIQQGQRKLKHIFESIIPIHYIDESQWQHHDPDGLSFMNINTPNQLSLAQALWAEKQTLSK